MCGCIYCGIIRCLDTQISTVHLYFLPPSQIEIAVRKLSLWHPSALTLAELKFSRHHGMHYWPNLQEIVTGKPLVPSQHEQHHRGSENIVGTIQTEGRKIFDRSAVGLGPCKDEEEQVRAPADGASIIHH